MTFGGVYSHANDFGANDYYDKIIIFPFWMTMRAENVHENLRRISKLIIAPQSVHFAICNFLIILVA